jgi:hypothetical protein
MAAAFLRIDGLFETGLPALRARSYRFRASFVLGPSELFV